MFLFSKKTKSIGAVTALMTSVLMGCAGQQNPVNVNDMQNLQMPTGIIGGSQVMNNDTISQSVVGLLSIKRSGWSSSAAVCTGTLIDDNTILTAAHCISDGQSELLVFFGKEIKMDNTIVLPVIAQAAHPEYVDTTKLMGMSMADRVAAIKDMGTNGGRDIAVIRFARRAPANYRALPMLDRTDGLKNGTLVTTAGFGITNPKAAGAGDRSILRKVDVPISQVTYNPSDMLLDQRDGSGSCHGDSGGPALLSDGQGGFTVVGVTSRAIGIGADTCSGFVAYTSTAPFHAWVHKAAQELMKVNPQDAIKGRKVIPVSVSVPK